MDQCNVETWQGVALAVWAIVEFWLGRTNLIHSGSTLELALNILKGALNFIFPKSP